MDNWSRLARRIRVPMGFAFAAVYAWQARPTGRSLIAGAVVAIPGMVLRALASGHVLKNEQLTTTGPYAYTRNPLYLGSVIMAVGFCLAARSWWIAGLAALFFAAIYVPVIRSEEQYLRQHFSDFDQYAAQVPRFLPRLRPVPSSPGAFSWALYRQHREYNAVLGGVAMILVLIAKLFWVSN